MEERRVSTLQRALGVHRSAFQEREAALRALAAAELEHASGIVSEAALAACRQRFEIAQRAFERVLKRLRRLDEQSALPKHPFPKQARAPSPTRPL